MAEGSGVRGGGSGMRAQLLQRVRRQAAKVVQAMLKGDADRHATASIRSLIYVPSVVAKKATLALTCQTLKYLPVLKEVLAKTDLLSVKRQLPVELVYVLACDLLFGQELAPSGDAERTVLARKNALRAGLARLLVRNKVSSAEELLPSEVRSPGPLMPRYVRVNTLKMTVAEALARLRLTVNDVELDDLVSNLLVLPAGTDLHKHPLVLQGCVLQQGKASCMPAEALAPAKDWVVLDACAAPGNKTVHLAALMEGQGKVIACEVNEKRVQRLRETVQLLGASNVEIQHQDFLRIDPELPDYVKVRAILLDPSCSGSGTTMQRLDYLLPSAATGRTQDETERQRVEQLARFQETALLHALSFPGVERVVYSTCSIHQRENEDVIKAVLPYATANSFQLATPFPSWSHRGLPVFDGAHHLLRTEAARDRMDGFFVALFVRTRNQSDSVTVQHKLGDGHSCQPEVKDKHVDLPKDRVGVVVEEARSSILHRRKLKRKRKKERLFIVA